MATNLGSSRSNLLLDLSQNPQDFYKGWKPITCTYFSLSLPPNLSLFEFWFYSLEDICSILLNISRPLCGWTELPLNGKKWKIFYLKAYLLEYFANSIFYLEYSLLLLSIFSFCIEDSLFLFTVIYFPLSLFCFNIVSCILFTAPDKSWNMTSLHAF